jgi:hypothetical protein
VQDGRERTVVKHAGVDSERVQTALKRSVHDFQHDFEHEVQHVALIFFELKKSFWTEIAC